MPDRDGRRDEYVNCADISIGKRPHMTGAGTTFQEPVTAGSNTSANASTAEMTNSELLEALLVLADVNPVADKVMPLSTPSTVAAQPQGDVPKHEQLIQELQQLGVLVPVDTPNQGNGMAVETMFTSPDAHTNPDYFLEQLQNLGVLVPVDPSPSSSNTATQQAPNTPSGQSTSSANTMQSVIPNTQSPVLPIVMQSTPSEKQLVDQLKDIGVLVPVDQALNSGQQSNQNIFKAQESKIKRMRENELARQLHGLGVIVPVGHVVQSQDSSAAKDTSTVNNFDPFKAPRATNIQPTNTFSSQSNILQSNGIHSSRSSQNTQVQRRTSQLGDIFNTNTVSQNQVRKSQQTHQSRSTFTSSQGDMSSLLSPTRTQTHMESSRTIFTSSSSVSSRGQIVSSGSQMVAGNPPQVNSQFGNFGRVQNRNEQNVQSSNNRRVSASHQAQQAVGRQNTFGSRNILNRFHTSKISSSSNFQQGRNVNTFSSNGLPNNLSPPTWQRQHTQHSLSQNAQNNVKSSGFGLSGNNQITLSQGGAFLGDVVQGSDKRKSGKQSLSRFDQGLSSPAGSLSSNSVSQSTGFQTQSSQTSQTVFKTDTAGNTKSESVAVSAKNTNSGSSLTRLEKDPMGKVVHKATSMSVLNRDQEQSRSKSSSAMDAFGNIVKSTDTGSVSTSDLQQTLSNTGALNLAGQHESKTTSVSSKISDKSSVITNTQAKEDALGNTVSKTISKQSSSADKTKSFANTNSKRGPLGNKVNKSFAKSSSTMDSNVGITKTATDVDRMGNKVSKTISKISTIKDQSQAASRTIKKQDKLGTLKSDVLTKSSSLIKANNANTVNVVKEDPTGYQVIDSHTKASSHTRKNAEIAQSSTNEGRFGNKEGETHLKSSNDVQQSNTNTNTLSETDLFGNTESHTQSVSNTIKENEKTVSNVDLKINTEGEVSKRVIDTALKNQLTETVKKNIQKHTKVNLHDNSVKTDTTGSIFKDISTSDKKEVLTESRHLDPAGEMNKNVALVSSSVKKQEQQIHKIHDSSVQNSEGTLVKNSVNDTLKFMDIANTRNKTVENLHMDRSGNVASKMKQSGQRYANKTISVQRQEQQSVTPVVNLEVTPAPTTSTYQKETLTIQVPSMDLLLPIQLTTPPLDSHNYIMTTTPETIDAIKTDTFYPSSLSTVSPSFRQVPLESIQNSPAFPSDTSKRTSVHVPNIGNTTWGSKEKLIDQQGRESIWVSPNEAPKIGINSSNKSSTNYAALDPSFDPNALVQSSTESSVKELPPLGGVIMRNSNNARQSAQHRLDPFLFGIGATPKFAPQGPLMGRAGQQTPHSRTLQQNRPQIGRSPVSFKRNGLIIQKSSVVQNQAIQRSSSVPLQNQGSSFVTQRPATINVQQHPATSRRQPTTSRPNQRNLTQRRTGNNLRTQSQMPERTARVEVVVRNPADSVRFFSTINNFPPAQRQRILELLRRNRITNLQFANPHMLAHLANMQIRPSTPPRPTTAQISHFMRRLSTTPNGRRLLNQWRRRMIGEFQQPQRSETVAPPTIVQATAIPQRENTTQSTSRATDAENGAPTLATFLQQEVPTENVRQQFSSAINLVRQLQREQQAEELLQQHLQEYTRNRQFSLARTVLNTLQLIQERRSGLLQQIQELRREIHASNNKLQAELTEAPNQRIPVPQANTLSPSRSQTPPPPPPQTQQSSSPSLPRQQLRRQVSRQQQPVHVQRQRNQFPRQQMFGNRFQQILANMQRASRNRQRPPVNSQQMPNAGSLSTQPRTFNNRNNRLRNLLRRAQSNPFGGLNMNRSHNRPRLPVNNGLFLG